MVLRASLEMKDLFWRLRYFSVYFYSMRMNVEPAYMNVHPMHTWCLQKPEEGVRFPGTIVIQTAVSHHVSAGNRTPRVTSTLHRLAISPAPSETYLYDFAILKM